MRRDEKKCRVTGWRHEGRARARCGEQSSVETVPINASPWRAEDTFSHPRRRRDAFNESMRSMHCIRLHCIALHCIAFHCIALHCNAITRILSLTSRRCQPCARRRRSPRQGVCACMIVNRKSGRKSGRKNERIRKERRRKRMREREEDKKERKKEIKKEGEKE
jgi:hypothetical protein